MCPVPGTRFCSSSQTLESCLTPFADHVVQGQKRTAHSNVRGCGSDTGVFVEERGQGPISIAAQISSALLLSKEAFCAAQSNFIPVLFGLPRKHGVFQFALKCKGTLSQKRKDNGERGLQTAPYGRRTFHLFFLIELRKQEDFTWFSDSTIKDYISRASLTE